MPAFANIVGNDYGAHGATPVAHTFVPNQLDSNGVASYVEAGATSLDDIKVSLTKRITADNGRIKCVYKIAWPITATETINGVASPKLLRTAFAELTLTADAGSTLQERENILTILRLTTNSSAQPWVVFTSNSSVY